MLWSLIIGIIVGWLAGKIFQGTGFGLVGDLVVGIIGAVLGGFLFGMIGLHAVGVLGSIIVSTIGAIAFLWVLRWIAGFRSGI